MTVIVSKYDSQVLAKRLIHWNLMMPLSPVCDLPRGPCLAEQRGSQGSTARPSLRQCKSILTLVRAIPPSCQPSVAVPGLFQCCPPFCQPWYQYTFQHNLESAGIQKLRASFLLKADLTQMSCLPCAADNSEEMLEGLLCKLVRWAWQEEYLLEVLPKGLSCTRTTSSPGFWQYLHGTSSTRWAEWDVSPHGVATSQSREFRGLLLLIFRDDLPLRRGSVVLRTAMIWQTYKMGHKPAGDSWLEILWCLKEQDFNN